MFLPIIIYKVSAVIKYVFLSFSDHGFYLIRGKKGNFAKFCMTKGGWRVQQKINKYDKTMEGEFIDSYKPNEEKLISKH